MRYRGGASIATIADVSGHARETVRRRLVEAGVPLRSGAAQAALSRARRDAGARREWEKREATCFALAYPDEARRQWAYRAYRAWQAGRRG